MPFYGPWLTAPPDTVNASFTGSGGAWGSYGSYGTGGIFGTTYADLCESGPGGSVGSNTFTLARADIPTVQQMAVYFQLNAAFAAFADYAPALPPGATGIDYEGAAASEAWLTGIDAAVPLSLSNASPTDAVIQARGIVPPFDPITGGIAFVPGATLATLALDGTVALPSGTSATRTLNATVPSGAVTNGAPGVRFGVTLLHFDGQISHVGPVGNYWSMLLNTAATLTAAVHYQPRRYRFVYPFRPPLAHRQRRDGTATAGPQLAHIGTAGGRPPLAWRQNNP